MTATSVVEVMASSNAIKKREAKRRGVRNPVYEVNSETHASHESIQSLLDNENHQVRNEIAQVSSLSLFYHTKRVTFRNYRDFILLRDATW